MLQVFDRVRVCVCVCVCVYAGLTWSIENCLHQSLCCQNILNMYRRKRFMLVCVFVYVCTYNVHCTYVRVCVYVHVCVCMCMCVCVCVYVGGGGCTATSILLTRALSEYPLAWDS